MAFTTLLGQIVPLFLMAGLGALFVRVRKLDSSFQNHLTNLTFDILLPAMIISSMSFELTDEYVKSGGTMMLLSVLMLVGTASLGLLAAKLMRCDVATENIIIYGTMFSNTGFIGYALIQALYGDEALFFANLYAIVLRIAFYSVGIMLMQRGTRTPRQGIDWKGLSRNLPILATVFSVVLLAFHIQLPAVVLKTAGLLGNCVTPIGMILIGMSLAQMSFRELFASWRVYLLSTLRLVVVPGLMIIALAAAGLSGNTAMVPIADACLPVAVTVTFLAGRFGGNVKFASQVAFISTLFSLITIPIMLLIAQNVIGGV